MNSESADRLSITEEQLFAIIGRLHVENMVLRARLAEHGEPMTMLDNGRLEPSPSPPDGARRNP